MLSPTRSTGNSTNRLKELKLTELTQRNSHQEGMPSMNETNTESAYIGVYRE